MCKLDLRCCPSPALPRPPRSVSIDESGPWQWSLTAGRLSLMVQKSHESLLQQSSREVTWSPISPPGMTEQATTPWRTC